MALTKPSAASRISDLVRHPGGRNRHRRLSTLTVDNATDYTYSGIIRNNAGGSSTLSLSKGGAGTLALQIANRHHHLHGQPTVSAGTLQFRNTADLAGMSPRQFFINGTGTLEFQSSVGGANRPVLNNKTFTFDSVGGGTINFNNGNHLFQGGGSTHNVVTSGGAKNTISSTNGGFMNIANCWHNHINCS